MLIVLNFLILSFPNDGANSYLNHYQSMFYKYDIINIKVLTRSVLNNLSIVYHQFIDIGLKGSIMKGALSVLHLELSRTARIVMVFLKERKRKACVVYVQQNVGSQNGEHIIISA